jgi:hypothetical protein
VPKKWREKWQKELKPSIEEMKIHGGPRYVIGGAHGRTSVHELIEEKIALGEEPPIRWLNWPCKMWWAAGGPEDYHLELDDWNF